MSPRRDHEGMAELGRRFDRCLEDDERICVACGGSGHDPEDGQRHELCKGQGIVSSRGQRKID